MSQELEGTLTNTANLVGTFGSEGGGGTSNYNDLINKPSINSVTLQGNKTSSQLGFAEVATSGNYNDLSNKPTIPAAQVNSDWNATSGVAEILNKPTLAAVATSGNYNDLTNKPTIPAAQVNSDWNATSGVAEILNKPTLAAVATSGDYSDLTGTPTIPAAQVNSDWDAASGVAQILNKPTIPGNATDLPISGNDPTDTKTYIDTKIGVETGSIAIPTTFNATINRQQLYKMGRVKLIDMVITLNQSLSGATHFITLQSNMQGENSYTDIIGTTKNGESFACYISGTAIYFNSNLTIASGTVICITGAYI